MNPFVSVSPLHAALGGAASGDADALDFFSRAGITDDTQKSAVDTLVKVLKTAGIWSKMYVLYPFVGGTAASHSHNLKSANYLITAWNGGMSHNANGITGNGTDAWANINFSIMNTTYGSIAIGIYSRSSIEGQFAPEINTTSGPEYCIFIRSGWGGAGLFQAMSGSYGSHDIQASNPDSKGIYILSRESVSLYKAYKDGSQIGPDNTNAPVGPLVDNNFSLLGPRAGYYSAHNLALAFISDGLSAAECASLSTAAQAFQTTLGRNV